MTVAISPLPGTIITNLPSAISLVGAEIVPIVQGGTTKRTTILSILQLAGSVFPFVGPTQIITTAGTHAIAADIAVVLVNKSILSNTPLVMASIGARNGLPLHVSDVTGLGGDITFTPDGTDTFMGLSSWTIGSGGVAGSGASVTWYPNATVLPNVWYL